MRDLKADLEICNKATRGPWVYDKNDVDIWSQPDPWRVCSVGLYADMVFIAQAREGWPHAIGRAIKAEAEVELIKTEDEVARLKYELYAIEKNIKRIIAELDKESEI